MRSKIRALGAKLLSKNLYSRLTLITTVTLIIGYFVVYAAYQTFNSSEYQSGAQLTSTFLGKVVSNLNDLNGRFGTLTSGKTCTSDGTKINCATEPEFDKTPIFSTTNRATNFTPVNNSTWQWMGTSVTIVVPAGPNRKYRISSKLMGYSTTGADYLRGYLSTSNSTLTGVPLGIGSIYEYATDTAWHTIFQEGYVELAPGTYTYYLMVYGAPGYMVTYHFDTTLTNIIAWPLQ